MADRREGRVGNRRRGAAAGAAERSTETAKDLRQAAEASIRQNAEALRKAALPVDAEPAFVFKP